MTTATATDEEYLDQIRRKLGLNRPQFLRLLSIEKLENRPEIQDRVVELQSEFAAFAHEITDNLHREIKRADHTVLGVPYLSTVQVSRCLGIGEFHVARIRSRGILKAHPVGGGYYGYTVEDVLELLDEPKQGYQSPLSGAFIRYLEEQDKA